MHGERKRNLYLKGCINLFLTSHSGFLTTVKPSNHCIMKPYIQSLKKPARRLRSNMTDAEQKLWYRIRRKQILGVQFYRQKPLLNYIVDFYCASAGLVIELGGGQHFEPEHQNKDTARDKALAEMGLYVLRFDNLQVLKELDSVVARIDDVVEQRLDLINPP